MSPTELQHGTLSAGASSPRRSRVSRGQRVSLCEVLDRVLNKGVVIAGDVIISIANVDLLYLGLNAVITSVETMQHWDSRGPTEVMSKGE